MICLGAKVEQYDHLIITTPQREKKKKSLGTNTFFWRKCLKNVWWIRDQQQLSAWISRLRHLSDIGAPNFYTTPRDPITRKKGGRQGKLSRTTKYFYVRQTCKRETSFLQFRRGSGILKNCLHSIILSGMIYFLACCSLLFFLRLVY